MFKHFENNDTYQYIFYHMTHAMRQNDVRKVIILADYASQLCVEQEIFKVNLIISEFDRVRLYQGLKDLIFIQPNQNSIGMMISPKV